jgi:hypothetical protein
MWVSIKKREKNFPLRKDQRAQGLQINFPDLTVPRSSHAAQDTGHAVP